MCPLWHTDRHPLLPPLPMATEIERKFLLRNDDWRREVVRYEIMHQGYLSDDDRCSVRVRIADEKATLNIKSATLGVARSEFEYPLPLADARELLALFCRERSVHKVRYYVPRGRHVWEIDVFAGRNRGLTVAEIELARVDEFFDVPDWLGDEVSDDPRYYNSRLIDTPFEAWPEASQR
jgi:adenylate cyclase